MTLHMYPESKKYAPADPSEKRALGDDPVPSPGHSNNLPADYRTINGWGADLENRPMFPRELPSRVKTVRGPVGARQTPHTKVHVSVEQPDLTPVFGASVPPHGLSGLLRDYAYQFGEAANRHWMTLILADRVDMVEHLIGDALRGRPDHWFEEKGWSAKLKYDPGRNRRLMAIGALALGAVAVGIAVSRMRDDD